MTGTSQGAPSERGGGRTARGGLVTLGLAVARPQKLHKVTDPLVAARAEGETIVTKGLLQNLQNCVPGCRAIVTKNPKTGLRVDSKPVKGSPLYLRCDGAKGRRQTTIAWCREAICLCPSIPLKKVVWGGRAA